MKRIDIITEAYPEIEFLQADGFDDAIIGTTDSNYDFKLIYSRKKCIEILMSQDMSEEEANEYFDFNVAGSFMGEQTPIWVDDTMFD